MTKLLEAEVAVKCEMATTALATALRIPVQQRRSCASRSDRRRISPASPSLHIRCRSDRVRQRALWWLVLWLALGSVTGPPPNLSAQAPATIIGRVTDEAGQPIQNVAVTLVALAEPGARRTVLTDAAGTYRLIGLGAGRYRLRTDRLGYTSGAERDLALTPGERRRLDLVLAVSTVVLEGVLVEGRRDQARERARFETEPGVTARVVEGSTLKALPGLAEADVMRAIELLPGVVSTSDFSSAFHVRGGSADQNLFLLDGFPIFNPFHLGGLFGVFNADAIARAELFSGGFGAEYGGRVSSVLNVESRAPEGPGLEVTGGVSLLAARVLVGSTLPESLGRSFGGSGGSWLVSARRSYFDQVLAAVVDFPYHITDLQSHLTIDTWRGGRLSFTGYTGRDVLDLSDFQAPGSADASSVLRLRWSWGNDVIGGRLQQPLGGGWISDSRLGYTTFGESLGFLDFGDVQFSSGIAQVMLRSDLSRDVSQTISIRTGGALDRISYDNRGEAGGTVFFDSRDDGVLGGAYASIQWRPDSWIVEPGLRVDSWWAGGGTHALLSPRFAAKKFFGLERETAAKFAIGRYTQFLQSLRNEEFPVSNDTWIAADRFVPPVVSDQVQLGLERFWGDEWSASVEAYYRTFRGVSELNIADDPNDPSDDLLSGSGSSRGLDVLLRRTAGPWTGWLALSWLRATRTLPNPLAEGWDDIPPDITFAPIFDRRLDLDLVAQYELPRAIELGVRWNYGSPLPYTRPVGQHVGWRLNTLTGSFEPLARTGGGPPLYVVLGERNEQRYPPYHRLDVTARRTFERNWGSWTPYLQVLNVYNRRNVLFYFYNYDQLPPTRSGLSMFPVLPALGVEVAF